MNTDLELNDEGLRFGYVPHVVDIGDSQHGAVYVLQWTSNGGEEGDFHNGNRTEMGEIKMGIKKKKLEKKKIFAQITFWDFVGVIYGYLEMYKCE
jgi:hypothetical protein